LPLFDQSDAAVRQMIKAAAKKRGYIARDRIDSVLPSQEVTSDQIEDVLTMLNEVGIHTVQSEQS
jgi:RNA polymerase primary sigma factor